ncbi:MAG: hypothetical protein V1721_01750 [Pseudomonadota bacterium]
MKETELAAYLLFFARFEYALTRSGFFETKRPINNDGSIKAVVSNWDAFIKKLPDGFYKSIKDDISMQEIFKDGGPKIWAQQGDDPSKFHSDTPITDVSTLIYACKHIRNNIVHGEKLERDAASVQRNQQLLSEAQHILCSAMKAVPAVDSVFQDISRT